MGCRDDMSQKQWGVLCLTLSAVSARVRLGPISGIWIEGRRVWSIGCEPGCFRGVAVGSIVSVGMPVGAGKEVGPEYAHVAGSGLGSLRSVL
jgi:hypothetical protein